MKIVQKNHDALTKNKLILISLTRTLGFNEIAGKPKKEERYQQCLVHYFLAVLDLTISSRISIKDVYLNCPPVLK